MRRYRRNPNQLYRSLCDKWQDKLDANQNLKKMFYPKIDQLLSLDNEDTPASVVNLMVALGQESLCEILYFDGKGVHKSLQLRKLHLSMAKNEFQYLKVILKIISKPTSPWYPLYNKGYFHAYISSIYREIMPRSMAPDELLLVAKLFSGMVPISPKNGLSPFYVGKYEVTQALWYLVMGEDDSDVVGATLPVENVSWFDCIEFCNELSKREDLDDVYNMTYDEDYELFSGLDVIVDATENPLANGYRLLTGAEWRYAAEAESNYIYAGSNDIWEVGWSYHDFDGLMGQIEGVGQKKANRFGLYDMSGNVGEWVWDRYDKDVYKRKDLREIWGGNFNDPEQYVRVTSKDYKPASDRSNDVGFRLARNMD